MKVATIFSAVRHVPITYLRFARQSCPTHFLCAYLCVTEFPSVDYTREIWIFEPASSCSANLARPQPGAILLGMFPQLLSLLAVLLLCCTIPIEARVVRVEVSSRADVLNGQQFGEAGAYERIVGRVYFSVAVANLHNRRVVDLDNAENLKDGEVAFSSDFIAVRPSDERKGSGSMLL